MNGMEQTASRLAMPPTLSAERWRLVAIGLISFFTLVDLFATQAILPALAARYAVSPAAMGLAVNASTLGMAVAALVGVLLAAVIVFGRSTADELTTAPPSTLDRPTTTDAPSTTAASTTSTAPTTTTPASTPSTTAAPQAVTPTGTAGGELTRCRRAPDGGVLATVLVTLTSGGAGRFKVDVGLVDRAGQVFARGEASSGLVEAGAPATVDVPVKVDGPVSGSCELLSVTAL